MQRPEVGDRRLAGSGRLSLTWDILIGLSWPLLVLLVSITLAAAVPLRFQQLAAISRDAVLTAGQLTPEGADALARLGLSAPVYAGVITLLEAVAAIFLLLIGALVFWRRSDNAAVLYFAFTLVTLGMITSPLVNALQESGRFWDALITFFRLVGLGTLVITFLRFPDGRFVPNWSRWLAVIWLGYLLLSFFVPPLRFTSSLIITSDRQAMLLGWALSWLALIVVVQVYRYRARATREQQQQTKWIVYGLFIAFGVSTLVSLPLLLLPSLREPSPLSMAVRIIAVAVVLLGQIFFSLTVTIAILRYRLYDIDVIINRTLVYGLLTGALVTIYFVTIVVLQSLLPIYSEVATVLSTLVVASAFAPLRRRIQALIDRRFYRRKYDAVRTLSRFAVTARDEVNLQVISDELVTAIVETVQPVHVSLWLSPERNRASREALAQR